jgi:hypothetical protein
MTETKEKIVASMSELGGPDLVEYDTVPGFKPGEVLRIGSLTAGDFLEWVEKNEGTDGEAKKTAGLRLITKSLVGPEPENVRYADDAKNIDVFRAKRHRVTEAIIRAILKLNGMVVKKDGTTQAETDAKKD